MNTVALIQGHRAGQESILVNCDGYKRSSAFLVGVEGDDSIVECWPLCFNEVITVKRTEHPWCGYGLHPSRLVEAIACGVEIAKRNNADNILWTECDSAFFGPVPPLENSCFNAFIAGTCPERWGCGGGLFLHPPFWMKVSVAELWIKSASERVETGRLGNGTTDVFSALCCADALIDVHQPEGVWSTNGLDMRTASKLIEARSAYNCGAWHIHGIKRKDHLDFITDQRSEWPTDVIME